MGYADALEAAGAVVHDYARFGDYQGTWIAKVTYNNTTGYVFGSYGSCSGCDSFQAEFDYVNRQCDEHQWDFDGKPDCEACKEAKARYDAALSAFGASYLTGEDFTQTEAENYAKGLIEWGDGAEMLEWLKRHVDKQP